jgi:hypothetical protein
VQTGSRGVYSVAHQPALEAVLLMGYDPTELWLYDLESGQAWPLARPEIELGFAVAVGDDRVVLVGETGIVSYRFERTSRGFDYEVRAGLNSTVGFFVIAASLPERGWLAAGFSGTLCLFDLGLLPDAVLMRGHVGD